MRRVLLTAFFLLVIASALAQSRRHVPQPVSDANSPDPQFTSRRNSRPTPEEERLQKEFEKGLNKERYKNLKKDTDHLLELATQLKEHVDKAGENVLSLEVTKKAEEIEKLSKKIRERMLENYKSPTAP